MRNQRLPTHCLSLFEGSLNPLSQANAFALLVSQPTLLESEEPRCLEWASQAHMKAEIRLDPKPNRILLTQLLCKHFIEYELAECFSCSYILAFVPYLLEQKILSPQERVLALRLGIYLLSHVHQISPLQKRLMFQLMTPRVDETPQIQAIRRHLVIPF